MAESKRRLAKNNIFANVVVSLHSLQNIVFCYSGYIMLYLHPRRSATDRYLSSTLAGQMLLQV